MAKTEEAPMLEWTRLEDDLRYVDVPRLPKNSLRVFIDGLARHKEHPTTLTLSGWVLGPEGVRMLRAACDEYLAEVEGGEV